jgi:cytochrome c556
VNSSLRLTAIALLVGGLGSVSCGRAERDRDEPYAGDNRRVEELDPRTAEGARVHAGEGRQLRDVMHELAERTAYAPTSELPADPESDKAVDPKLFAEVAELADALAAGAARIPAAAEGVKLFREDREAFEDEAATLRRHAQDLGAAARSNNVERMQRTFDRIHASCIGCHSRFRDFAGQLDFQRASAPAGPEKVGALVRPAAEGVR